jgi:hypothetical protein
MAAELLVVAESRHGPESRPGAAQRPQPDVALHQFVREHGQAVPRVRPVPTRERPPLSTAVAL